MKMPPIILERIPLPSLYTYSSISVMLFACSSIYVHLLYSLDSQRTSFSTPEFSDLHVYVNRSSLRDKFIFYSASFIQEPWCFATLINMAYCCMILIGKLIQRMVFGQLRVIENQHIRDKFWNFVFYKFIFIFGVMNVQEIDEIILWCTWFSILGFLYILTQLCKDRFEYFSSSPATAAVVHCKVLALLIVIHGISVTLMALVILYGAVHVGINTLAFMIAECILLLIKTLYVIVRYSFFLWDSMHDGVWENQAIIIYYADLVFEMVALCTDFCHHLHMLLWGNIFLSMASLVICMQLRYLFHEFQRRMKRHKNYCFVVSCIEAKFPMVQPEELLRNNDDCAICWERMDSARKLPCGHMFHNACLRSWLEQDTSCPTCRISLSDQTSEPLSRMRVQMMGNNHNVPLNSLERHQNRRTNHFHFDGSRYVSWWPTFSVEVTHLLLHDAAQEQQIQTSQFDGMVRQVREVFPDMPQSLILEDLKVTRSVELTIDNIVDGRVVVPAVFSSTNDAGFTAADLNLESDTLSPNSVSDDINLFRDQQQWAVSNDSPVPRNFLKDSSCSMVKDCNNSNILPYGSGFRFSKSPAERETMLALRKDNLLDQARRRFVAKDFPSNLTRARSSSAAASSSGLETPIQRYYI